MVPMFTCGLLRSNFSFAMFLYPLFNLTEALLCPLVPTAKSGGIYGANPAIAPSQLPALQNFFLFPPTSSNLWSGGRDLNPQPSPWKSETLPLSYPRPAAHPHHTPV